MSNKKNESQRKDKITWGQTLRLHLRAVKDIRRVCPHIFTIYALSALAKAVTPYVIIWFSARIINELASARRTDVLWPLVAWTVAVSALLGLVTSFLSERQKAIRSNFWQHVRKLYSEKMFSLDFADADRQATHDLLSQIIQNANWAGWGLCLIPDWFGEILEAVFGIVSALALSVSLFTLPVPASGGWLVILNHPLFVFLLLALMLLITAISGQCISKAVSYYEKIGESIKLGNRLFGFLTTMGMEQNRAADIRMYGQRQVIGSYWDENDIFSSSGLMARATKGPMGLYSGLSAGVSAVFTGFVYVFTCLKAWAGAFGVGSVTQYVGAVTALSSNVTKLFKTAGNLRTNMTFLQTNYKFLDIPNSMYQGSLTTEKRADRNYEVEFQDVSFRYPGTQNWALRHISVKFQVGSRLAVVGENGSGKTTFIKLLCRLYDPDEGHILLNGIDIRKYSYRDYIDLFSVVFQDFQLLSQPLGANVAGREDYDRERVRTALSDAGFDDRLAALPKGLDTLLYRDFGDDGVNVSGGEAQKIAIARALYKDAPFIILDEPTAALDPIAEAEIYAQFNQIAGDKTAVYISHRLSSCRFCDEILVFDHGAIVEQGSHDTLLSHEGGKYRELWNAQAQYYEDKETGSQKCLQQ